MVETTGLMSSQPTKGNVPRDHAQPIPPTKLQRLMFQSILRIGIRDIIASQIQRLHSGSMAETYRPYRRHACGSPLEGHANLTS